MAKLEDSIAYLWVNYPHKQELSRTRLTKMVYLADWRSALVRGTQLTSLRWFFNHHGPFVPDVTDAIQADPRFELIDTVNAYGHPKTIIRVRSSDGFKQLDFEDRAILDFVLRVASPKTYREFIQLVYSTYPISTQQRYAELDLVQLARKYREGRAPGDVLPEDAL